MISVCVPVYNDDVRQLAQQLSDQAGKAKVPVEILVFDDGSDEQFKKLNRQITELKAIRYQEMNHNLGRAGIRNFLGKSASNPWLLFIDGDSLIDDRLFLENYMKATSGSPVVCGGTVYSKVAPEDKTRLLRWIYGCKREQLTAFQRISKNKFAITANNFLINREIFLQYPFRETISGYGHEDTVLGYDLFKAGILINHIDNPVRHNGLETSAEYLLKTRKALENLLYINREIIADPWFQQESALLRCRMKIKKMGLLGFFCSLFMWMEPLLKKNLTGRHPRLLFFDLYRMGYICKLK